MKPRLAVAFLAIGSVCAGCHSNRIDVTIDNRTGQALKLLEVDYPSASYGVGSLAPGAQYRYGIQVRGSGVLQVQYTTHDGRAVTATGPAVYEKQQGRIAIILLPNGEAEFHPTLVSGP